MGKAVLRPVIYNQETTKRRCQRFYAQWHATRRVIDAHLVAAELAGTEPDFDVRSADADCDRLYRICRRVADRL